MVVRICSDGLLNDLGVVQAMGCCVLHLLRPTIALVQESTLARSSLISRQSTSRRTATVGSSDGTLQTLSSDVLVP